MRRSSMVKRLSFLAMMLALSVLFHYIESMIPPLIPIPGVKLGLANLISFLVLYYFSIKEYVYIGAGHTTVAMYELEMNENYTGQDIFNVELRYKDPKENDLNKKSFNQAYIDINEATEDFMFQAAVVEFALILRDSKYKYDSSIEHVLNTLSSLNCVSNDDYKSDFKKLVSIYSDYSASLKR